MPDNFDANDIEKAIGLDAVREAFAQRSDPSTVWPDPLPLRDELPPVLSFRPELLPNQLRGWALDIAERMNVPTDLVAIPAVIAAGALIGRRVGIRPQRKTDWLEVGNVWGCTVARPGSLKTPAGSEALGPIRKLEAGAAEENESALAKFKAAETLYKIEREEAEKSARSALKDGGKADPRGAAMSALLGLDAPTAPGARRHLTSDATAEKLGEICAANPNGIMVHRDELLSLFSDLDNPEKSTARGFFLTGWSGLEGYTFDRIARGTVRVPAVNLSLFGTTQPNRLAAYIRQSIRRFDDGMVQRLQLLAWPDPLGGFVEADRHPDSDARRTAHECYHGIASLDVREIGAQWDEFDGPNAVPFLRFADRAQDAFTEWRASLERKLRNDDHEPAMLAHLSKYRGLIPRLALICHVANNGAGPVSMEAAQQAFGWADYLESHARRAYASTGVDNAEVARAIWRRIEKGDLPSQLTSRMIQRKEWSGIGKDLDRIEAGLEALLEARWIRGEKVETGGRPSMTYCPNPKALRA